MIANRGLTQTSKTTHRPYVVLPLESIDKKCTIEDVDLVMWTKNSAKFLPSVLTRIEEVIPSEVLANKIIIDDHSTDDTVEVARKLGWTVYTNNGSGIYNAVETALKYVTTDFFISIEHDVILSKEWWESMKEHMKDETVAVAQGVRVATSPILRALDEYVIERRDEKSKKTCISIDNNLYRTSLLRKYKLNVAGHTPSRAILEKHGFRWLIDRNVISDHIRPDIQYLIKHDYRMHKLLSCHGRKQRMVKNFTLFLLSPFRAFQICLKKKCAQMLIIYPLDRLAILMAC
jgi:glycosyltransferase involved in cell wall biosynthesis